MYCDSKLDLATLMLLTVLVVIVAVRFASHPSAVRPPVWRLARRPEIQQKGVDMASTYSPTVLPNSLVFNRDGFGRSQRRVSGGRRSVASEISLAARWAR